MSRKQIDMAEGATGLAETPHLDPQNFEIEDKSDINQEIAKDLKGKLKSKAMKVTEVTGRAHMMDPNFRQNGIDYSVGGLLDRHWIRNTPSNIEHATSNQWVFPETISPRLKNQTHNELVLMVRLKEQSDNRAKYIESVARGYEKSTFKNTPEANRAGLGEFEVTQPTKRAE